MRIVRNLLICLPLLTFLPAIGQGSLFAPSADPWPRWEAHDPASATVVDHGTWDRLLTAHVRESGGRTVVDYSSLAASDAAALDSYIAALSGVRVSGLNRSEQLAFWLNLYNALTVQVVLKHMPVTTIRDIDISPGILSDGPWGAELVQVEGVGLSLNDIEHRILRPIWRDARIHYGVNCASIGCPDLVTSAFSGKTVDAALDRAARDYVNDPRGVSISDGRVTVSSIYDWFIDDFGGDTAGVLQHLQRYSSAEQAKVLKSIGKIDDTAYDWSLNGAR